jgi:REP element-mobilizing transposase RayT
LAASAYRESNRAFSVTLGTAQRQPVFSDRPFATECLSLLVRIVAEKRVPLFAYCLMPDHVHLLLGSGAAAPLPSTIQAWKSLCYRAWRARGHEASFWQRSFFDHALRRDADLRQVARYIVANPVRKGLVTDFRDYPLSGSLVYDLDAIACDQ